MSEEDRPDEVAPSSFNYRDCCVCGEPTNQPFPSAGSPPSWAVHDRCEAEFRRLVESGEWGYGPVLLPPPREESEP